LGTASPWPACDRTGVPQPEGGPVTLRPRLLLGTHNPGKQAELRALLGELDFDLVTLEEAGIALTVPEPGPDYATHARDKALAYARAARMWSVADDSGLEVDALGGAPGLGSARLGGDGNTDADRRKILLGMLAPHPRPWTARFRATVALASPLGQVELGEGVCLGEILPVERGRGGFGYDPLFLVEGTGQTMAELSLAEKNRLSHRARAIQALWPSLQALARGLRPD
jgi:XTP/dITP diphosphohydrolase